MDAGSSYVVSEISNYFEKLENLRFIVCDSCHSPSMTQIKSNGWEHKNYGVCDSNHSLHMIQIMQKYYSNHKLHMIRIT